jgi:hypothetical protein
MAANETPNRRGAYLPVLPDGWTYEVGVSGPFNDPDGVLPSRVTALVETTVDGSWRITFTKDDETRQTHAVSLSEALSFLSRGVRAVVKAERDEVEARKARQDVLNLLGEPMPGDA